MFKKYRRAKLIKNINRANADIMCFGHTHKPFYRILHDRQGDSVRLRHAVNISAAGKPKDNNPRGCYVVLTIDEKSNLLKEDGINVNFMRFPYDVDKAAKAIEQSTLPDKYAKMLRTGQ